MVKTHEPRVPHDMYHIPSGSVARYFFNIFTWCTFDLDLIFTRHWLAPIGLSTIYGPLHYINNLLLSVGSNISTWSPTSKNLALAFLSDCFCNISETFVVLPGQASINPPNVHVTNSVMYSQLISPKACSRPSNQMPVQQQLEWTKSC